MSEQVSNSPEHKNPKPLTDNCDTCQKDYELTASNTFLFHYSGQSELDHMFCTCTHCKAKIRIFIGEETLQQAIDNGITPINDEKYAPLDLYDRWIKLQGIELPKTYELTNRHEALIHRMGEVILSTPDEHLFDLITDTGYGRPHPQKWID